MIWYDTNTGEPVAPGSCEDDAPPSIEGYDCIVCKQHVEPQWSRDGLRVDSTVIITGIGWCPVCGHMMLTTGMV